MYTSTSHSTLHPSSSLPCPPAWPPREDIGPGWRPLASEADRLLRSCGIPFDGEIRFRNLYGCLWIDISYCSTDARQALQRQMPNLRVLKARSREVCEVCGQPGETTPRSEGWVTTLCPKHHVARRDGASWDELMGYRPQNVPSADRIDNPSSAAPNDGTFAATAMPSRYASRGDRECFWALGLRWRSLASDLATLVPEAAEAYRAAADELEDAICASDRPSR